MNTLKAVLLNQYIGAIAAGYLVGRGIEAFFGGLMPSINTLLTGMVHPDASLTSAWTNARLSLLSNLILAGLYFIVAYLLVIWLYAKPAEEC